MNIRDGKVNQPDSPPSVIELIDRLNGLARGESVTTRYIISQGWISRASLNRYANHKRLAKHKHVKRGLTTHWKK